MSLSKIDLMTLNYLIYNVYNVSSLEEVEHLVLEELHSLIEYDVGDFYLSDTQNPKQLTSPVTSNIGDTFAQDYLANYQTKDYAKGLFNGRSKVFRESDIISDQQMVTTDYYRQFYQSYGLHFSLHLSIAFDNHFLGIVSLYRKHARVNFTNDEIETLNMLTIHLESRLNHDYQLHQSELEKFSIEEIISKFNLTRRETVVMKLLITDASSIEISEQLNITHNTLKKHTSNIYQKLQITNRIQLIGMIKATA